ncbi:DMT family transporter [Vibrio ponticus]|uniref:DMT family transporter n=1 Tax=Vibrio ponticus TaxID=265668 RepID=A0A3N3E5W7_9VIBR|nr:DMT family transporter [Vibrio ponticus]ROV62117.1 DMT family transporter [Vibrio ponticus]
MLRQWYPVLFMLSSTFSLSLTGLLTKYLTTQLDSNLLSFLRFLLPSIILMVFFIGRKLRVPPHQLLKPIWVRAFCIGACQVCFIYSLSHLTLVESVVLFGTGPLFLPLLEKLIYGVSISGLTIVALVGTFAGVVLLAGDVSGIEFRVELLVGLAAGVFNAGSQLSLYRASKSELNPYEINFWTFIFAALFIVPILLVSASVDATLWHPQEMGSLLVMVVLLVLAVLIINTQVFRARAYKLADSGSQLAPLIFTNLLFTALWQLMFFDVSFNYYQLMGLSLSIVSTIANVLLPRWLAYRQSKLV